MGRHRGEAKEVEIFNISFLDVFCCAVGALLFILFVLTVDKRDSVKMRSDMKTEDMKQVARQLVTAQSKIAQIEEVRDELEQEIRKLDAQIEDSSQDKEELVEELAVAKERIEEVNKQLAEATEELETEKKTVEQLAERLTVLQKSEKEVEPAPKTIDPDRGNIGPGQGIGPAFELPRAATGYSLLGNLELQAIVATQDGLFLGTSETALPVKDNPDLRAQFRQFLRYHNPKQEGIWRTIVDERLLGIYLESSQIANQLEVDESIQIGKGLEVAKDDRFQEAQKTATKEARRVVRVASGRGQPRQIEYVDQDGDGRLDTKRINIDSDRFPEEVYLDFDPTTGRWRRLLVDSEGDNVYNLLLEDVDMTDSDYEVKLLRPNLETRSAVFRYEDTDSDGLWDAKYENLDSLTETWEKKYTRFDVQFKRWGEITVDGNGDGIAEVLWRDTDMSDNDWEEKLVDDNRDGRWDVRWKDAGPADKDWELKFTEPDATAANWRRCELDTDADGIFDVRLVDSNGDAQWDEQYAWAQETETWQKAAFSLRLDDWFPPDDAHRP